MDGSGRWYSIKEVAARYEVGRDTIVRRIKKGHLKALVMPGKSSVQIRVYNVRRIHESELQRFERENTVSR
jgi:excisionase family DNA binding protein